MAKNSPNTIKTAKTPKHIIEISMTPEKYYELKVYLKSILLPGTPPVECKRLDIGDNKRVYRQWINNALEEIGPKFFPGGRGKGLVWPEDHVGIYKAVHQVVRALSIGVRNNYKKNGGLVAVEEHINRDEMGMAQGDSDVEGVVEAVDKEVSKETQKDEVMAIMTNQDDQNEDSLEEWMDAPAIELEDLLGVKIGPEMFAHIPDLAEDNFDWEEIMDWNSPEPVRYLTIYHIGALKLNYGLQTARLLFLLS
ncbi:hypothetical protein HOY82DRAFT_610102 [Tuber indicum]|nr:hypothetical protein HOY82DRAFT_610102 [Tuber indicum]